MNLILSRRAMLTAAMAMVLGLAGPARAASVVTVHYSGTFAGAGNGTFSGIFQLPTAVITGTYTPITVFSVDLSAYPALDYSSTTQHRNSDSSNISVSKSTGTAVVVLDDAANNESLTLFFNIDGSGAINFGSSPPPSIEANVSNFTANHVLVPPNGLTLKIASGSATTLPEPPSFALAVVGAMGMLTLAKSRRSRPVA